MNSEAKNKMYLSDQQLESNYLIFYEVRILA